MRRTTLLLSSIFVLSGVALAQSVPRPRAGESFPDRLVVQHRIGSDSAATRRLFTEYGAVVGRHQDALNISVLRVDPRRRDQIRAALEGSPLFNFVEPDYIAHKASTPDDPDYSLQWHLPAINAPSAWNITTGSASVPIAFVDSGVDPNHPDLAAKIIPGWNFLTGTSNTADVYGHGTTTAGVAAAITDNDLGVAGVAWQNPIMPLVVLDASNNASYSDIASAIIYAAQHGVRIVNVSLAGTTASSTLQSAVNYAWSLGTVVFAAAGNGGSETLYYPAACQHVVSVAATDDTNTVASWSSYGPSLTLSAPGVNIFTTTRGGGYAYASGTSYSAPIAAGVGALVLSYSPSLAASSLVSILESSATPLGSTGYDPTYGYGLVNAYEALVDAGATHTTPAVTITSPASTTVAGLITVGGTATDNIGIASVQLFVDGVLAGTSYTSSFAFAWNSTTVANGAHTLMVNATDTSNNVGSATITVTVNNAAPPPVNNALPPGSTTSPPGSSTSPPVSNTPPADTTPPTVYIQTPTNGTIVGSSVTVTAVATDNVGVTQVSFYVDGVLYYTTTVAPYTYVLNTSKLAVGTHTMGAKAWDAAGNVGTSNPVTFYIEAPVSTTPILAPGAPPTPGAPVLAPGAPGTPVSVPGPPVSTPSAPVPVPGTPVSPPGTPRA